MNYVNNKIKYTDMQHANVYLSRIPQIILVFDIACDEFILLENKATKLIIWDLNMKRFF